MIVLSGEICKVIAEISYKFYVFYDFGPLIAASGFPFSLAKKGPSRGSSPRPWEPLKNNKQQSNKPHRCVWCYEFSERARVVISAPAKAEERWGKDLQGYPGK